MELFSYSKVQRKLIMYENGKNQNLSHDKCTVFNTTMSTNCLTILQVHSKKIRNV